MILLYILIGVICIGLIFLAIWSRPKKLDENTDTSPSTPSSKDEEEEKEKEKEEARSMPQLSGWLIAVLVIIAGGWMFWSLGSGNLPGFHQPGISAEEQQPLDAGWKPATVVILTGPEGEPVIKVHLPESAGKIVQFRKYRWTKSYSKPSPDVKIRLWVAYNNPQTDMKMGRFSTALMSGEEPPPDIIWWKMSEE